MKLKVVLILLLITSLTGCPLPHEHDALLDAMAKQYNIPSSHASKIDNTKYIRVEQIPCDSLLFELYQDRERGKQGLVLLKAFSGSPDITKIGDGDSLLIKLDDTTHAFKSNDPATEHVTFTRYGGTTHNYHYKTYIIPESFVRAVASSNVFLVKLNGLDNFSIEGKCSARTLEEYKEHMT